MVIARKSLVPLIADRARQLEPATAQRYRIVAEEEAGGTPMHAMVAGNVIAVLHKALRAADRPYGVYTSDLKIKVGIAKGAYRFPDVAVVCGEPILEAGSAEVVTNPILIIEVLSKGTAAEDLEKKPLEYEAIPSLKEYIVISQDGPPVYVFRRGQEPWTQASAEVLAGIDDTIRLESVRCEIAIKEIYRRHF